MTRQRHEDDPRVSTLAAWLGVMTAVNDFRQMKDPQVVSFSPTFHWTDQKIRVHVF